MNTPKMKKPILLAAALFGAAMTQHTTVRPAHAQNLNDGYVRVLHAIPKGLKVDVLVDGKKLFDDVDYSGEPTKYARLSRGLHNITIVRNDPRVPLFSQNRRIASDRFTTLAILGTSQRPVVRMLNDTGGSTHLYRARLSVSHLSSVQGPIDVVAYHKNRRVSTTLARNIRYGTTRHFLMMPGPYEMYLRSPRGGILKKIDGINLMANRRYASYVLGRVGGQGDNDLRLFLGVAASQ